MGKITVVGLGPGRAGLITREAWELMEKADDLRLRTGIHPTVSALDDAGVKYTTYDHMYETAGSFAELYDSIAKNLADDAKDKDIVYAVPGSPLVAEQTVVLLRDMSRRPGAGFKLTILPGMSFAEESTLSRMQSSRRRISAYLYLAALFTARISRVSCAQRCLSTLMSNV